jgi:hypothetical protein
MKIRDAIQFNQEMNILFLGKSKATPVQIARDSELSKKRLDWQQGAEFKEATREVWECRA